MHSLTKLILVPLLFGLSLPCEASATEPGVVTDKPNFIIIFTDDQGYADLSCFGGKHVSTPRIDQMAAEGARLTNFYMAAPICTPSRAAQMTGCYPKRIGMADASEAIQNKLKNERGVDYKTRDKIYKQAVAEIDWSVGQILDSLKNNGIDNNTFVIFTSDNGPKIGSAKPLKEVRVTLSKEACGCLQ